MRSMSKISTLAMAAALLALAGCGSSSSSTSSSASAPTSSTPAATTSSATSSTPAAPGATSTGQTLRLAASTEGLKYDATSLTAKAGDVSIAFTNNASFAHNVTVASSSGAVVGATPTFSGGSKTLSLKLKAGTYKFYCSVPGHRAAGMEGTLTVQ
jgi:plastocyanin